MARARLVQRSRDQLVAGARFAAQEHCQVEPSHHVDLLAQADDRVALPNQAVVRAACMHGPRAVKKERDPFAERDHHAASDRIAIDDLLGFERYAELVWGSAEGSNDFKTVTLSWYGAVLTFTSYFAGCEFLLLDLTPGATQDDKTISNATLHLSASRLGQSDPGNMMPLGRSNPCQILVAGSGVYTPTTTNAFPKRGSALPTYSEDHFNFMENGEWRAKVAFDVARSSDTAGTNKKRFRTELELLVKRPSR